MSRPLHIETPRLILRAHVPGDAASLLALHSDPADLQMRVYKSRQDSLATWESKISEWRQNYEAGTQAFLCVVVKNAALTAFELQNPEPDSFLAPEGKIIGFTGFNEIRRDQMNNVDFVNVGILMAPQDRLKGYSKEALGAVIDYGFETMGAKRVVLDTQQANVAFVGFMRHLGLGGVETARSGVDGDEFVYDFDSRAWAQAKASWSSGRR